MELKTFGIKGKLGSAKQKVIKAFGLMDGIRKEDSNLSSFALVFRVAPHQPVKPPLSYTLEAERKKAEALMYFRMLDRPR